MTVSSLEITLDVFGNTSSDLRRRLRQQPERLTTSMLPGGMILEDREEEHVYRLGVCGAWTLERREEGYFLRSEEGVELHLSDDQMTLHMPKL